MENARPPYVLDFMAGVHNSERDDDRRALGWRNLWYRENFGLLKKHKDVSLYHRGIIDISDDW